MAVAIADSSQFSTAVPSRTGGTATLTRTHSVGIAVIFFHWDGTNAVSGVTFDGTAATVLSVSSGTNPSQCMAYAPCSSAGSHTWVLTVAGTCPTTQGLSATMTGAANTASQTATRSWQNLAPVSLGTLTINTNGLGVVMCAILPTGGTWTNATQVFSSDGVFRIATVSTTGATSHSSGGSGAGAGALVFDVAGGGTTYNDTLTESITAGDSYSGAATFANLLSEAVTAGDSVTSAATFLSTLTESITTADSLTSAATFPNSISFGITLADQFSNGNVFNDTLTESITAGFTATASMSFALSLSETITPADSLTSQAAYATSYAEGIVLADAFAATGGNTGGGQTAISTTVRFSPGNIRQSWGSASNRSGFRPGRIPRN